ncbi:MAG TPA: V-type ATPase subunit [Thermoplasmata archaeon]|jgi:V/A-type H+-transporting ATPase subunit C|nr:V-type ATPase subunit [Thermoplasmata archaeon]HYB78829.1 V-type ATPase subunit [Thermoplasmata archaeon]
MAASPYASSLGRLNPEFPAFLPKETYPQLLATKDANEFAKVLETTPYADDLARLRAMHSDVTLVELAINRTFVRRNRQAFEATPFAGRGVVGAYLGRWDIQNIELILTAKVKGGSVTDTQDHLVSSREIPAGLYAGAMNLDDFRILLGQPTLEAMVTSLVKYGYGTTILPFLEAFERTHNIFPILHALDKEYYRNVLAQARFFQGDEWVVRGLMQGEIDARNALLLLKGKDRSLPVDEVLTRWVDGGTMTVAEASDRYPARTVPELAERLADRFPSIGEGTNEFTTADSLTGYEVAIERDRATSTLKRLRTYPLSLSVIFAYLLRNEIERNDLRRAVFGRRYGVPAERLAPLLVSPRL